MENTKKSFIKTGKGIATIIVAAIVVIAGGVFAFSALNQKVEVPNVVKKSQDDAKTILSKNNLKVGTITKKTSSSVKSGYVISTDPKQSTKVGKNSKINLVVSSGNKKIKVADYTNKSFATISENLNKLGFTIKVTSRNDSNVESGFIISQDIAAGKKVDPKNTTITFVISKGSTVTTSSSSSSNASNTTSNMVTVPDYAGKSYLSFTHFIEANNLTFDVTFVGSSAPVSTVVANQTGTYPVGTQIWVQVSKPKG